MRHECYFCHIRTIENLIKKFKPDEKIAENFIFAVHKFIESNRELSNPQLATEIHRIAKIHLGNTNLYAEEKLKANKILLKEYSYWETIVNESENPFCTAAKLSVIGNIIDYGAQSVDDDISGQIESFFHKNLKIDMTVELKNEISKAQNILYLGDNCGEIVFDKLFIETMKHPNITFAVRGNPVINDVTLEDANQVGIDKVCRVISNGFDAPSTLIDFCSDEFAEEYKNADLIISKGQGNFEGLMESCHSNQFFLLIAKCHPIANLLGVDKNDMVVARSAL
ncbi:MAG: ARMT1-like domain-containing protein [Desulfobacter postgatei]|uniref:damage-control phosphatase ARMT1 family protein n=1 Tax=Desulfobacter postgatei TaxID=2293 RepID=UPI0023F08F27|nr:ARMT1-like domain-containing protein [Desulfobacter postgatei]MDD4273780.1 ARMT1-like domain-containing protein [Desulfobacter postgatei]